MSIADEDLRINRNILECKVMFSRSNCENAARVLIETYWNVKYFYTYFYNNVANSINRNILECKEKNKEDALREVGGINRNILECKGK